MDVGQDTSLGDGHSGKKLVELLIVADSELEMAGVDAGLLVVSGCVSSELKDLSSKVLEDGSEVDGGSLTNSVGVVAVLEVALETAHGELESGAGRLGLALSSSSGSCGLSGSFSLSSSHSRFVELVL